MKIITLQEAYDILDHCSVVIVDGVTGIFPDLNDLTGEDDNVFLDLTDEGTDLDLSFEEGQNQEVVIQYGRLGVTAIGGTTVWLTPLIPRTLEEQK